jgi:hypothetical protein
MRAFLLWTRVAWWALLVGVVELLQWLSGSRHGRATVTAALVAALGGGLALFHPAPVSTTRPHTRIGYVITGPAAPPPVPGCVAHLVPILISQHVWQEQGAIWQPEPSTPPTTPDLPLAICPVRVISIPLAQNGVRATDLVYHATLRDVRLSAPAQQ